ncbi:hypothetical protein SAMN00808754_1767 [Thermanaeromonas toyohensis ToBE]|uniref:Uncharacterized protein n=1 Tax=Thermanaeromonas toyohensis ToBE TaxID=698762 RepID=A0A1W1VUV3_9FIRM|nr:hypothetical protein [Thermanaeromonas toyohensis]SMB97138.1 hypothetical protein SAMN00808754_1767 [Thermanaeromonas toyohensis ToBE]
MEKRARGWTKEECVAALKRLSAALSGCRPTTSDLVGRVGREVGCPPEWVIHELFGSWKVAIREAGLESLPTVREQARQAAVEELRLYFDRVLEGKSFLFRGEAHEIVKKAPGKLYVQSKRRMLRGACREKGIRLLNLPYDRDIRAVVSWLLGCPAEGVLPEKEKVEEALGEAALRVLRRIMEVGNLKAAAQAEGLKVFQARRMLVEACRRAVRFLARTRHG